MAKRTVSAGSTRKAIPAGPSPKASVAKPNSVTTFSAEERHQVIARTAYFLAEARGFAPNAELDDWLRAERTVDATLLGSPLPATRSNRAAK